MDRFQPAYKNRPPVSPSFKNEITRRKFLRTVSLVGAGCLIFPKWMMAGTLQPGDFERLVPVEKNLDPEWLKSLFERGEPTIYSGASLSNIGMPVGGLCAGQLYLGGNGKLWHWDIFNDQILTTEEHYAHPIEQKSEVEQGFALRVISDQLNKVFVLDNQGFQKVTFSGQYPIATVAYSDPSCPVSIEMEAFSPFAPLSYKDSSFPATVMRFTLKNTSSAKIEVELGGWLENAIGRKGEQLFSGNRRTSELKTGGLYGLVFDIQKTEAPNLTTNSQPTVFADFEGDSWGDWKAEGTAFGTGPTKGAPKPEQRLSGFAGNSLANSWAMGTDSPTGKLTSPPFTIQRRFISFLIGGGDHMNSDGSVQTGIQLLINGKVVRTATGSNSDAMTQSFWDVSEWMGQSGVIEIVDSSADEWGHIDIDQIEFSDTLPSGAGDLTEQTDVGTMVLALLNPGDKDRINPEIESDYSSNCFAADDPKQANASLELGKGAQKLVGAVVRSLSLDAGQSQEVTFILAWHFPNLILPLTFKATEPKGNEAAEKGRYYATQFDSAHTVAAAVAQDADRLFGQTKLWRDNWYDSTLPYWFLDRTLLNISTLATSTAYRFANGRFFGWEGVGSCTGTCTHVWSYEQAMGRLFPELDILRRETVELNPQVGFDTRTGAINNRGEAGGGPAGDGEAGTILRCYRDYLVSTDDTFLRNNWPNIKLAIGWLFALDSDGDGIADQPADNTLDARWYGKVPWIAGYALAAIRAGEQMATVVGDTAFAQKCKTEADLGRDNFVKTFWNGEYFEQIPDPTKLDQVGSFNGCEIDQVLGQSWAFQVGLDRIVPQKETKQALDSIWKYNFATDVGPFRKAFQAGRWFAMPGEAGTLMCSWPHGDKLRVAGGYDFYFNECMNGFEHQVAGHMIWEGMVQEGFAIERAVHDRYDASKRNPWNEVECGDHYARSMASYGVFLAACGFEYNGPQGHIAFAPRVTPEKFKAAFTTAEGWGSFSQEQDGPILKANLTLKWGKLQLSSLALSLKMPPQQVTVTLDGNSVKADHTFENGRLAVTLQSSAMLAANSKLEIFCS